MTGLVRFFCFVLGLALLCLGAWLLRRSRLRELEYARVQLYEDAEKPFAYQASESDSLMAEPVQIDEFDAVRDAPPARPGRAGTSSLSSMHTAGTDRARSARHADRPKGKGRKKAPLPVDDVSAVQALIKRELEAV